jgi:hydrogenase maturation protein HypF
MRHAQTVAPSRGHAIRVRGLVQGVGFRPTVWRIATECGLAGEVWNDAEGVMIRAWGEPDAIEQFIRRVEDEAPPLARIDAIEGALLEDHPLDAAFHIVPSRGGVMQTGVVPDAATCPSCLAEISEPRNRRHRYPFSNCTHCGPRLSILRAVPYDRANTSMAEFALCSDCREE